ncbi:uncharacterized protein LOC111611433 isoform X2 [Xiphophorus maculatus]|uniref:uncharacterized protein LOC111611433 isoform X2 n=1 Tax=Xiphophorus maculatus TaxID=8083 RepID=UPI000C6EEF59|nr:uncharacterized protein LOC111611433 isoform X2 [Xiphophorus maculatus]
MAAFRWIQMVLLLILMLQFKAQTETQQTFLTVRDGNEVTLPCGNRRDTHDKSDETIWFINDKHLSEIRTLIKLGNSHREMKTISDRLSVTANGSLLLHEVTEDDAGRYTCRWTISGQLHDFAVYLSVITIVEQEKPDKVALFCSVIQYDHCLHEVKWLYEGKEEKPSDMKIYQHSCSATVTFPTSHQKLDIYPSLTCKVTNSVTKAVQLIPFSLQSSEVTQSTPTATHHWTSAGSNKEVKQQGENQRKTTKGVEKTTNSADLTSSFPWWYIFTPLCLAMVLITVLVIIIWNKTKGNKTQIEGSMVPQHKVATNQDLNPESSVGLAVPETSQNTTEPEDDLSYATINFKKSKKETGKVQETVIYSTVGTSSSSAGVSSDTDCLYSTVNKK